VPDAKKPLATLKQAAHGKKVWTRMRDTDVLVIDEISMCENVFFERPNAVLKEARNSKKAFGGVQLVVTGDPSCVLRSSYRRKLILAQFCQLSPVKPFGHWVDCGSKLRREPEYNPSKYHCDNRKCEHDFNVFYDRDKWAFRSRAWKVRSHVKYRTTH